MRIWGARGLLLLAAMVLSSCKAPKYALYTSVVRDFQVDVPWAWNVMTEQDGSNFSNATFIGPFEPDFYLGAPSFSIRWHRRYYPHKLPGGKLEMYSDTNDYIAQLLKNVYGPRYTLLWKDKMEEFHPCVEDGPCITTIMINGREAKYFVVKSAAPAQPGARWGTAMDTETGASINPRQHAYVIVPMANGFYVIVYPATREGYPKYEKEFNQLASSFLPFKDGPEGASVSPPARVVKLPVSK